MTAAQARQTLCPKSFGGASMPDQAAPDGRLPAPWCCILQRCMAWNWLDKKDVDTRRGKIFADARSDIEIESMRTREPHRPKSVPASWVWEPITGTDENSTGGYWVESEEEHQARVRRETDGRAGYCSAYQGFHRQEHA